MRKGFFASHSRDFRTGPLSSVGPLIGDILPPPYRPTSLKWRSLWGASPVVQLEHTIRTPSKLGKDHVTLSPGGVGGSGSGFWLQPATSWISWKADPPLTTHLLCLGHLQQVIWFPPIWGNLMPPTVLEKKNIFEVEKKLLPRPSPSLLNLEFRLLFRLIWGGGHGNEPPQQ